MELNGSMLDKFKDTVDRLTQQGVDIRGFYVHPLTMPVLVEAMIEAGLDPQPNSHWDWKHPFRKRDYTVYAFGRRVEESPYCPVGSVGVQSNTPFPKDEGVGTQLSESGGSNVTDLMIQAMEDLDRVENVVVIRYFKSGGFDTFSLYNQLELPTVLQNTLIRMVQQGGER